MSVIHAEYGVLRGNEPTDHLSIQGALTRTVTKPRDSYFDTNSYAFPTKSRYLQTRFDSVVLVILRNRSVPKRSQSANAVVEPGAMGTQRIASREACTAYPCAR